MGEHIQKRKGHSNGPTLLEVASAAGVSIATASRVVNGLNVVSSEVRERVLETAAAMNYVPHITARNLALNRANAIGLVLPELTGEPLFNLIRGVEETLRAASFHLVLTTRQTDIASTFTAIQVLAGRTDGLLIGLPEIDVPQLCYRLPLSFPIIDLFGRTEQEPKTPLASEVEGGRKATAHLVSVGCTRIVHVAGPEYHPSAQARLQGYRIAMNDAGLEPKIVFAGNSSEAGRQAVKRLSADGIYFDGAFASNDEIAIGMLFELRRLGRSVPEDCAVVGYDDIVASQFFEPPLTSVRLDTFSIGHQKCLRLLQMVGWGKALVAGDNEPSADLIVRGSSTRRPTS